jgi:hypothetical protein
VNGLKTYFSKNRIFTKLMKAIRSILSILIASVILVSTTSFTISMHMCGGRIASIALLDKAAPCFMEQLPPCHQQLMKKMGCCEDHELKFEGKDLSSKVQEIVQLQHQQFSWSLDLPVIYREVLSSEPASRISFAYYSPPLLDQDITLFKQSFLI